MRTIDIHAHVTASGRHHRPRAHHALLTDHGTKVRPELKHMKRMPSEYLRRFSYDTIGHDDRINSALVRLVGADRVLLGTDYCFDMGLTDPVATIERLDFLSVEERNLIKGGTAAQLLRL